MDDHTISASTQYNDLKGNLAIDGHTGSFLFDLARKNGIDTEKNFPISFGVYIEGGNEQISIDTVDVATSYDDLKKYLASNPGALPVKRFDLDISFKEALKDIKRFSCVATIQDALMNQKIEVVNFE